MLVDKAILSLDGRITCIKSSLASFLIYHLSLVKISVKVANFHENIQMKMKNEKFLSGREGDEKKINFVNWATVSLPLESEGN